MLDIKYKKIAVQTAKEGKNKLQLMMRVPNANEIESKQINNFYDITKEILNLKKKGVSDEKLINVITKIGYTKEDFELIRGEKEFLADIGTNLVSLLFVLVFVFIVGSLLLNVLSSTDWDFMKKDFMITGLIFGDDVNFNDMKISSNAVLKDVKINGNEYSATIRCSKELTLSFAKKGFVPVHKNISCEEQKMDIVFATMNEFVKLNLSSVTNVEDKGVKLDLNGGDLVILGTNIPAVNPSISVTAFNPNTPGDMQYFPGELEGLASDGNITGLESYGFAKIIAQDENGNSLDFKNGKSAKLTFPIDEAQLENAPSEMPLWYFDEIKGTWVEEGLAKKTCVGNVCEYVGEMNRVRSAWNLDKRITTIKKDLNDWKVNDKNDDCNKSKVPGLNPGVSRRPYDQIGSFDELLNRNSQLRDWYNAVVAMENATRAAGRSELLTAQIEARAFYERNYGGSYFGGEPYFFNLHGNYGSSPEFPYLFLTNPNTGLIFKPYNQLIENNPSASKIVYIEGVPFNMDHVSYTFLVDSGNPSFVVNTQDFFGPSLAWMSYSYSSTGFNGIWWGNNQNYYGNSLGESLNPYSPSENNSFTPEGLRNKLDWSGKESYSDYLKRYLLEALKQVEDKSTSLHPPGVKDYFEDKTYPLDPCEIEKMRKATEELNKFMKDFMNRPIPQINLTGKFIYSGESLGFSLFNGVNLVDGGLFTSLVDNIYLSTTKKFTSSYFDPKIIVFTPFAYAKGNKLVLVTENGEVELNGSIPENTFSVDYNYGQESYKKVGNKFLLNKIKLNGDDLNTNTITYSYENSNLSKVIDGDSEKLFVYDGEDLVKIIYVLKNIPVLEYNLFYENNKISLISVSDYNKSFLLNKFSWGKNKLEIDSSNNHLTFDIDNSGRVTRAGNVLFEYTNDGVDASYSLGQEKDFAFLVKGQSITRIPVAFENIGKSISFTYSNQISSTDVGDPKIVFAINKVPSIVANASSVPSNGAIFGGYALQNCSFWNGYPIDLADCIIGWDKINRLTSNEALNYALTLNLNNKDTGIVYTKLANYFVDLNFCYNIFGKDYYSGLACMKSVDEGKVIYSTQNISNIVNKNMVDYDLSFTLRNLAEYYMDRNYCLPIPTESKRLACLAKFPEPIVPPTPAKLCGNGVIDGKEKCDGNNFIGKSCETYGFDSGNLFCVNCQINKSGCFNIIDEPDVPDTNEPDIPDTNEPVIPTQVCGNALIEGNEDCDATNFDGATCVDYGFVSGTLNCVNCRVVTSSCVSAPITPTQVCGNNIIEGTEQCEGTNYNGKTCATYGFNTGNLSCSNCQLRNNGCSNTVAPPVEIDPLQIFDCPYNENYSSPIKDITNNSFWIKEIQSGKIFGLRIPFKKSDCVGETVLTEDASGNIIPCITQLNDVDGCILEKRELGVITAPLDNYVAGGKYENKYKQNPVDFVGGDGNIYFMTLNAGKHEFVKFNSINTLVNERVQVYDANDYTQKVVPSVMRAIASGNVIWIVLNGSLYNIYVTAGSYGVMECRNYTGNVYSGCNGQWGENNCFGTLYGAGVVFMSKNYSGEAISRVGNEVYCRWTRSDILDSHTGSASISGSNFDPTKMTYAGDGFGNLLVRSTKDINEYSTDSTDANAPSATR